MSRSSYPVLPRERKRVESGGGQLPSPRGGEIVPPGASRRRILWSALVGLPGWAVVVFILWKALKQPTELVLPLSLWVGLLVLLGLIALSWACYAKRPSVVERKRVAAGREVGVLDGELLRRKDALGRELKVDPGASTARVLVVRVEGGTKTVRESS